MYWTLELASKLEDAPWPASKEELIDYAIRSGAPLEVIENLQEIEDEGEIYESIEDIWPDYPSKDDFFFNEDEKQAMIIIDKSLPEDIRSIQSPQIQWDNATLQDSTFYNDSTNICSASKLNMDIQNILKEKKIKCYHQLKIQPMMILYHLKI